jgi:hypothetical protein
LPRSISAQFGPWAWTITFSVNDVAAALVPTAGNMTAQPSAHLYSPAGSVAPSTSACSPYAVIHASKVA